ncbi:MAG: DUF3131 domain-containing protein [Clostridia bacterium]|nr:DUF3131 domain-containing protein [Clostridia bacterium]
MNRISAWFRKNRNAVRGEDEFALSKRMRALAVKLQTEGRRTLRLPRGTAAAVRRIIRQAERLRMSCMDAGEAMDRLVQSAGWMQACAEQACRESAARLPAAEGMTRVERIAQSVCGQGDHRLTKESLLLAIASFDDVQPLEMAELWAVPEAVRVCLSRAYLRAAQDAMEIARERRLAERWADDGSVSLKGRTAAFYEYALRLMSDGEDPFRSETLEAHLGRLGVTAERAAAEAHAAQSVVCMRIDNLVSAKRLLDALDWQACFETLSAVEQELACDPAGIYPRMEADSRAAVREQAAYLAARLELSELTVARHAVRAAQMDSEKEENSRRASVCYWLYDDEGRRELAKHIGGADVNVGRRIPDPTGRKSVALIIALFILIYGLYWRATDSILYAAMGIPLAWGAAMAVLGRFFPIFVKPAKLLKLKMETVPDELRTLVVMPVLLSSKERAEEICDQMEALGCMERDANIRHLILGDYADSEKEVQPEDAEIVGYVRQRIEEMNRRAGWEQFFYLHRRRERLEADGRWMGRDRKRGALMALNRLILGLDEAENAFGAENSASEKLRGRFRYVLTIDADTRFLPGSVQRMIGAIAHPMNASRLEDGRRIGCAVLQPQMELAAGACVNGFVKLFAGTGGMSTYPSSVSGFWQDVTGEGLFGGKGIYDVAAFHAALDGELPEGKILSHDLIEGTLAGTAQVSDICFYDGFPTSLGSFLKRRNRWTRGDWQLLPVLLSARKYPFRNRKLSAAERIRLLDNLLRSFWSPALLGMLTQAVWLGHADALAAGLLLAYWTAILCCTGTDVWRRATAELALLPACAASDVDAIVRSLWRLLVTKKHLLDWVTSADAEKGANAGTLPGRISAALLIPGLFSQTTAAAALALGGLFLTGAGWMRDLERESFEAELSEGDAQYLRDLARDTWKFFERFVTEKTAFLPPDNVQIDPPTGVADRTSPTNIGLYLMSCIAATNLGWIAEEELRRRMEDTMDSLERLERWNGHFYNWYSVKTLEPLLPRYVSSVDSGNLAAALLLCASALGQCSLSERMNALAKGMDFSVLYDADRNLFRIGAETDNGRLSESHYDLLASESRILSFAAIMLGQAPLKHWKHLGRTAAPTEGGTTLLSWSGTMFEYLMPELFMHAPENSLLGGAMRAAIRAQRAQGEVKKRPWGISESGFAAFDVQLNYQYRAFGLHSLALGGQAAESVVAPYASALAVFDDPKSTAENLRRMELLGWRGAYGMYEAADYTHERNGNAAVVRSHMAHHQGMALCALCNALTGRSLSLAFQKIPEARAISLLLEEKRLPEMQRRNRMREAGFAAPVRPATETRRAQQGSRVVDVHLMSGAGASVLAAADGSVHYRKDGVDASRFDGDFLNRSDGACVHVETEGRDIVLGGNAVYFPGGAEYRCDTEGLRCEMHMSVSPEDGTLFKRIVLKNPSEKERTVRVTDCVPAALARFSEYQAHAAYRNLFVESVRVSKSAVMLRRRTSGSHPVMMHMISAPGSISCETDYERLAGRMGSVMRPGGIRQELSGTAGPVLNPCSALQTLVSIEPGAFVEMHFALALMEEDEADAWRERNFPEEAPRRAEQLASMQSAAMLGFIGLKPRQANLLDRLGAMAYDRRLISKERHCGDDSLRRETLWPLGISGELPVIQVRAELEMKGVRDAVKAHEFYRALGVPVDLALISEHAAGYDQPVRDRISDIIACSHLGSMRGVPGGVHILDVHRMDDGQRAALDGCSMVSVRPEQDFFAQVRSALSSLDMPKTEATPMETGESRLEPMPADNGFGRFLEDGRYCIDVRPGKTTPAPWVNMMANDSFGALVTERGGAFLWYGNSRSGRLTAFPNDTLRESWGWMLYLVDEEGRMLRLLPGSCTEADWRAIYGAAETVYWFENENIACETALCVRNDAPELRIRTTLRSANEKRCRLIGFVDWLMGTDANDAGFLRTWNREGACFASGAMNGVGYFAASSARVRTGCGRTKFLGRGGIQSPEGIGTEQEPEGGWVLNIPINIQPDRPVSMDWVIGAEESESAARSRVRSFYAKSDYERVRTNACEEWGRRAQKLMVETPDENLNRLANGWLLHQTLDSRIRARTGFYQPGGAYGFRDQLQDMLSILPFEPQRVRDHLLRCAAHQFEDGDVMHWWHEPFLGVRTHISDDMLFLPYVAAEYVEWTQDKKVLSETVRYLENAEMKPGDTDVYREMRPGTQSGTLHDHCMRAFRRAARFGDHGLALMGTGDWNDGMNRIGAGGKGESVWLTEFLAACAEKYARVSPDESDAAWLNELSDRLKYTVEINGWDGEWYLRAFDDEGRPVGSASCEECRIDAISQAWAVLAGLNEERCRSAMDSAWKHLADERLGIIRLLAPPFSVDGSNPGYICEYPEGIRENGAQYTHAACWLLLALIRQGDEKRAHRTLQMLLPMYHSDTEEKAGVYRVEPYVMAADIAGGVHAGRGGWTWYTGSAAWMYRCILELIGFERKGNEVRVCALLGDWPEAAVAVQYGSATYRLVSAKNVECVMLDGQPVHSGWIEMTDDGGMHEAAFPPREGN